MAWQEHSRAQAQNSAARPACSAQRRACPPTCCARVWSTLLASLELVSMRYPAKLERERHRVSQPLTP